MKQLESTFVFDDAFPQATMKHASQDGIGWISSLDPFLDCDLQASPGLPSLHDAFHPSNRLLLATRKLNDPMVNLPRPDRCHGSSGLALFF